MLSSHAAVSILTQELANPAWNILKDDVLTFTQTDNADLFLLDTTSTHGDPLFPVRGVTEHFYIAGFWYVKTEVYQVHFLAYKDGTAIFSEKFPQEGDYFGQWEGGPYDFFVPGNAPDWEYDVTIQAESEAGDILFAVQTSFRLG